MSRSMQLHYIAVTAFSETDLFLDRISLEWDFHGSAITNHEHCVTGPELSFFHKRKGVLKIDQFVKCRDIDLVWKLHAPTNRLLLPLIRSNLFSTSGGIFTLINFHGIPVYHYVYFIWRRAKRLKYFFVMPPSVGDRGAGRWVFPTLLNVPVTIQIPFTAGWSQRQVVWRACYFFDSNVPSASWNDFCLYIACKKKVSHTN